MATSTGRTSVNQHTPNPKRVLAGKLNHQKRGPFTAEGRERLRRAALANRPWEHATGPRTPAGKSRAAQNCKAREKGEESGREIRDTLAEVVALAGDMATTRRRVAELLGGGG
jgi:hypothetical protein